MSTTDFKRVGLLGKGAYAEVFLVRYLRNGSFLALKRMKKKTYNGLIRYVITEKEVQRKISHPLVCKLHFAFQTFDHLYLVSDYCAGGDLRQLLNDLDFLQEQDAAKLLAEVLVAIEEIHRNGIIHRDIKPENILIDEHGHAKLSDFGLAKEGIFE